MSNDVPTRSVQLYYNYDRAVVDRCHTILYHSQDKTGNDVSYPVPCVFATPDRAFSQIKSQIARKRGLTKEQIDTITIPLPIISLTRISQKLDLSRYIRYKFRRMDHDPVADKYRGVTRPSPWDLTYQVDVWARTLQDLDDITAQIVLWLRADELYLTVEHPAPIGQRIVLTQFQGMIENSKLDTGTEDRRTLRRSFTFVVHGWIVPAPVEYGIVRRILVDFYDNTAELSPVFLEQIVVTDGVPSSNTPVPVPAGDVELTTTTAMLSGMVIGEPDVGMVYGELIVPGPMKVVGLQATALGDVPVGADLILQLTLNGGADASRYVTIVDGQVSGSRNFGTELSVVAGDKLGVFCAQTGSVTKGSWIEFRVNVKLTIS